MRTHTLYGYVNILYLLWVPWGNNSKTMTFRQLREKILGGNLHLIKNMWETCTPFVLSGPFSPDSK